MDENNDFLFSEEEMESLEAPNLFNQKPEGPVTVLGHTFNSDDERREFFRDELRKRLPDLKGIEGFPSADDEDIISLSDPPYFTACPNPWLDDIVAEWEKDKQALSATGVRQDDNLVTEPYASDVSEGRNNPHYLAHSYHTKVPYRAVMRYILHYTQPGDVVFDGFAGTGMTGVAANLCGRTSEVNSLNEPFAQVGERQCICGDLSPYAYHISQGYNKPTDITLAHKELRRIFKELQDDYGWMYEVFDDEHHKLGSLHFTVWSNIYSCPNCGHEYPIWDVVLDRENNAIRSRYNCPKCGVEQDAHAANLAKESYYDAALDRIEEHIKEFPSALFYKVGKSRFEKEPSKVDLALLDKIEQFDLNSFYPKDLLPDGDKTVDPQRGAMIYYVHQFYTKRNLIALSALLDKIEHSKCPDALRFVFTSMLTRSNKMNRYRPGNSGGWVKGILNGTLYVPSLPVEVSVFEQLSGKLSFYDSIKDTLPRKASNAISVMSACSIPLKDNSVDYIFTDPPFGDNLMYSELNFVQESWLKVHTNNATEAIVNRTQHKGLFEYQQLMNRSLQEYYRILKPGKWLTMEFSNTSAAVWNSIQNALQGVGFIVAGVAALDKQLGSFNAVSSTTAVKQDLVITCFKPSEQFSIKFESEANSVNSVWDFVDEYLHHLPVHIEKRNATTSVIERSPKILYDRLISYFVQKGLPVPIDAHDFQKGLRERFEECDGMFFTALQLNEYIEKKKDAPDFVPMGLIVSSESDGIEWLRNRLRDNPQTYQQISPDWMQAINGIRKGDILPELMVILDENFIQESDGTWRLPNIQDDVDKDRLRTKALLREFKTYAEAASKPKSKIKEVRVEAIRAGFKQCYIDKDFETIVKVGEKIPQNLLTEDEILLQFYDIAMSHV